MSRQAASIHRHVRPVAAIADSDAAVGTVRDPQSSPWPAMRSRSTIVFGSAMRNTTRRASISRRRADRATRDWPDFRWGP
ncbi:hypothetical protein JM78_21150 [Burkholderia pyrrocinia]|nr:hypothetical protein JM78_21150 [Burkholderia pyrrocinia]